MNRHDGMADRLDLATAATDPDHLVMDETAFAAFYGRTARALWAYLARASADPALADDLVQEAYYRLLRARVSIADDDHLRHYLFKVATNLLRDHYRGARPTIPLEQATLPARPPAQLQATTDLERGLAHLKPRERELLWLAYAEGMNHREIAGVVGVRETSVRVMLHRARRRLHERLTGDGGRR